ncbi:unnamed protein product [Acanthosepion pharaonis]|uniref:Reverse transcriptase domain-containing protein n=1 Tax=Acanthosepion pharaonis TaxID=158019 RepID=A0A812B136_ACAPH|nr:unnamed protein product [Sepia pharaonis]
MGPLARSSAEVLRRWPSFTVAGLPSCASEGKCVKCVVLSKAFVCRSSRTPVLRLTGMCVSPVEGGPFVHRSRTPSRCRRVVSALPSTRFSQMNRPTDQSRCPNSKAMMTKRAFFRSLSDCRKRADSLLRALRRTRSRSRRAPAVRAIYDRIRTGISDYLYGILPNIPDPVVREKAKQAIGDPNGFSNYIMSSSRRTGPLAGGRCRRRTGPRQRPLLRGTCCRTGLLRRGLSAQMEAGIRTTLLCGPGRRPSRPAVERTSCAHQGGRCRCRPPPTRGKAGNIFTSRVTFIKKVEVPGDALEFRPIAIGNYFVRIFHRVLASRFEAALPNHRDQVGFKRLDGVAHNVLKLNAALNAARSKHENLVVASVDIRKAFDSISHEAILGILQRKGVPDLLMGYLRTYFSTSRLQIGKDLIHPKHRRARQRGQSSSSGRPQVAPATGGLSQFRDTHSREIRRFGVNSLETLYSTLKESRLTQLSYGDEEDAATASNPAVRGSGRRSPQEIGHQGPTGGYEKVPAVNSWLDHAPTNLAGHDFQEAIRVRLGCMGTPSRLSRGGRSVDTICKCGSNARMSLPHIAQACSIVSGLRIKRHNNVVLYVAQILKEKKFDVIMEPRLQTERGLRKPDLVILAKKEIIVLDVQIRPDSVVCTLDACNREKIAKYNQPYVLDAIRDRFGHGLPIKVIALTYNWRGRLHSSPTRIASQTNY